MHRLFLISVPSNCKNAFRSHLRKGKNKHEFWILCGPQTSSLTNSNKTSIWTWFSWLRENTNRFTEESVDSSLNEDQVAKAYLSSKCKENKMNFIILFVFEILWFCLLKSLPGSQLINKILNYTIQEYFSTSISPKFSWFSWQDLAQLSLCRVKPQ